MKREGRKRRTKKRGKKREDDVVQRERNRERERELISLSSIFLIHFIYLFKKLFLNGFNS